MKKYIILFILLSLLPLYGGTTQSISVASFNIQFLKKKKIQQPLVQNIITKIISKFDIIAIQEIQCKKESVPEIIVKNLNNYSYILGPRVGYSKRYKERYAYFYNTKTISYVNSYTFADKLDEFSREPLIARFKTIGESSVEFVLINIHTPPKFAKREIERLPQVMVDAVETYGVANIIALGDFNADCTYFDESTYSKTFPENIFTWAITNDMDTNVHTTNCTYDRIVLTKNLDKYINEVGVFRFDEIYKLTLEQTKAISDHYPVWINFNFFIRNNKKID